MEVHYHCCVSLSRTDPQYLAIHVTRLHGHEWMPNEMFARVNGLDVPRREITVIGHEPIEAAIEYVSISRLRFMTRAEIADGWSGPVFVTEDSGREGWGEWEFVSDPSGESEEWKFVGYHDPIQRQEIDHADPAHIHDLRSYTDDEGYTY